MPKTNRYINLFQGKTPRPRVNLGVGHHALDRSTPCASLTFKASFKRSGIAQSLRVTRLQKLQEHPPAADWHTKGRKRPRQIKQRSQELRTRSIKREHPTVKFEQSTLVAKIDNRGRATHNCNRAHTLRHFPRRRIGVGRATRNCQHPKVTNAKMIGQFFEDRWPINQFPVGLKSRTADPGPVWSDDTNTKIARG